MANDDIRWHSRVFEVLTWMNDQLESAAWPPHPTTNETPNVGVGNSYDPTKDEYLSAEAIDVVYRVGDNATIEWNRVSPAGRREEFDVDVYVRTNVPGALREDVWARLEALSEVVQSVTYDPATRAFTAPGERPWSIELGGLSRVAPQAWRTDEGWIGDCIVTFTVHTNI